MENKGLIIQSILQAVMDKSLENEFKIVKLRHQITTDKITTESDKKLILGISELQDKRKIFKEGIGWLSEQLSLEKMKEAKADWDKALEVAQRLNNSKEELGNCFYQRICGMYSSKERKDEAKINDHCIFYAGFGKFCPEKKDLHDNNGFCISAGRYCRVPFCNTREV